MGTLVAMAYPTKLFANQADHTYVRCGNGGKAWSCWGGKTGGKEIRRGTGSTNRADKIAKPDERAAIKCYLINGVCHQAANRILLPAGITVRGARGYSISEAMFGTYGRVGIWPCSSPFDQFLNVTGDLAACAGESTPSTKRIAVPHALWTSDKLDWHYIQGVLKIYEEARPMLKAESVTASESTAFHLRLFMYMAEFHLGPKLDKELAKRLKQIRGETERARQKIERPFAAKTIDPEGFVAEFNRITLEFQDRMAESMKADQYYTLFELKPDERIVLADQRIVSRAFK